MRRFVGILFIFALTFSIGNAQTLLDVPGSDPLIVRVSPEYPAPGGQVIVTLESFSVDLSRATITWFENGKQIAQDVGQDSYYTIAGQVGTTQTIDILVQSPAGQTIKKSVTISVGDVDLLWQARSYTPLLYKGKALYPPQGDILLYAIPHLVQNGKEIDPKKLVYEWERDGDRLHAASGYGRDTLLIQGDFGSKTMSIGVIVSTVDNSQSGAKRVIITPQKPEIVFYEDSLLYGTVFNTALGGGFNLSNREIRLKAIPYFFSTNSSHTTSPLAFNWTVGDSITDETSNTITLRQTTGLPGTSVVSVRVPHPSKVFQSATKDIFVNFKSQ